MTRWATPLLILALGIAAAAFALRTPAPQPAGAPPAAFSAVRAMTDVKAIAQMPHPMGSAEQARVQAYLLGRMTGLGLQPQVRPFAGAKGAGRNLLGVLPGRDRAAPAVLLMAHADSVPAGPGAADDGAGVAAVLETVRALSAQARQRDVMVLFTDGEELGMLGAQAFFSGDPARAHVGVVINLEARGNRGRALMFETHRNAAPLIAYLRNAKALAAASSLMPDLYRRLPNDTDLTEALTRGYQGLNFAFVSGFDAYHRPTDTPDRLDPGTLQHLGEQVLRATAALTLGDPSAKGPASPLPGRAPDQAYADILGGPVIQYPAIVGWALLLLSAGGMTAYALRLAGTGRLSLSGVAGGALAFLVLLIAVGAALYGLGQARIALSGRHLAPLLRHVLGARAGTGLTAIGVSLVWAAAAGRWLRAESLSFGALAILALGAAALQALAPLDAFILAWPFVLIGLALVLGGPERRWASWVILLAAEAQIFYWARLYFDLVGQTTPLAVTPFVALGVAALLPACPRAGKKAAWAGLLIVLVGVAFSLAAVRP
jgi:Peptidase family M28